MKHFVILSLLSLTAWGQTPELYYGSRPILKTFRGYSAYVTIGGAWKNKHAVTIDTVTNRVQIPTLTLTSSTKLRFFTTGTFPKSDGSDERAVFDGNTFLHCTDGATIGIKVDTGGNPGGSCWTTPQGVLIDTSVGFDDVGTGTLYATVSAPDQGYYKLKNLVLPTGVTLTAVRRHDGYVVPQEAGPTWTLSTHSGNSFFLDLATASDMPLGPATVEFDLGLATDTFPCTVGHATCKHFTRSFEVEQLNPIPFKRATNFGPAPNKAQLIAMLQQAAGLPRCNKETGYVDLMPGPGGYGEQTMLYYTGDWGLWQLWQEDGDEQWMNCALTLATVYRNYVVPNSGSVPAYRHFTDGFKRMAGYKNDTRWEAAIWMLAKKTAMRYSGFTDWTMREVSYTLEDLVAVARTRYGVSHINMLPDSGAATPWDFHPANLKREIPSVASRLMSQLELAYADEQIYQQTFMDGIAIRALIKYWEISGDPRVPVAVKRRLDWWWDVARVPETNRLYINVMPKGARCAWGCRSPDITLMAYVVPAYGWFGANFDQTYFDKGDILYSVVATQYTIGVGVTGNTSGHKQLSQQLRWLLSYDRWRRGLEPYRP